MKKNKIYAISIAMLITITSASQWNLQRYEVGLGLGAYVYQGDLTPSFAGSFRTMKPGINIYAAKLLNASFSIRANLAIAGLRGDDAAYSEPEYRKQRAFNFKSPLAEASAGVVWNVFGINYDDKGFSPYVTASAGLSMLRIQRDYSNFNADYFGTASEIPAQLVRDAAQRTPRIRPVVSAGAGVRYNLSSRFAVNAESAYRIPFTDYLDGFSQAVNPSKGDHYHSTTVGLIYRIGKKNVLDCPVIRY